jgi:hypothetical protein
LIFLFYYMFHTLLLNLSLDKMTFVSVKYENHMKFKDIFYKTLTYLLTKEAPRNVKTYSHYREKVYVR